MRTHLWSVREYNLSLYWKKNVKSGGELSVVLKQAAVHSFKVPTTPARAPIYLPVLGYANIHKTHLKKWLVPRVVSRSHHITVWKDPTETSAICSDFDITVRALRRAFLCRQWDEIRNRSISVFLFCTQQPDNTIKYYLMRFNHATPDMKISHQHALMQRTTDYSILSENSKCKTLFLSYLLDDREAGASSGYKAGSLLYVTTNTRHVSKRY